MRITKNQDNLIVEIPLFQHRNNPYDEDEETELVPNLVGVIAGDFEQGIYSLNDLSYKGATQLGGPLVMTELENDDFRKLCKELGLDCWEYDVCAECRKTLWGTHTLNDKGPICMEHEKR